jgi:hypothetical protein
MIKNGAKCDHWGTPRGGRQIVTDADKKQICLGLRLTGSHFHIM